MEPLPGLHIKGDVTLEENIADLGGVTIALTAYAGSGRCVVDRRRWVISSLARHCGLSQSVWSGVVAQDRLHGFAA
jgi:hypothetical protein